MQFIWAGIRVSPITDSEDHNCQIWLMWTGKTDIHPDNKRMTMILMLVCAVPMCRLDRIQWLDWMFKRGCLLVDEIRMSRNHASTWQQMFVATAAAFNMFRRSFGRNRHDLRLRNRLLGGCLQTVVWSIIAVPRRIPDFTEDAEMLSWALCLPCFPLSHRAIGTIQNNSEDLSWERSVCHTGSLIRPELDLARPNRSRLLECNCGYCG